MLKRTAGPMLTAGKELAEAAKQGLETDIEFENISPYVPHLLSLFFLGLYPAWLTDLTAARPSES